MQKKPRLGIINLGLDEKEFKVFEGQIRAVMDDNWQKDGPNSYISYKKINPTDIAEFCDAIVLSPGNAKVGLLDHIRASERDAQIGPLYNLIHSAVEGGIPLLGVNSGHEAVNCAYGWAIDKIPDDIKEKYQLEQDFHVKGAGDPKTGELDQIAFHTEFIRIKLTNNYAVLPRDKQKRRWGQDKVKQLIDFCGYPLISRVDSEAPVYGVQFNIQPGTKQIFRNFFALAQQYLERKQA